MVFDCIVDKMKEFEPELNLSANAIRKLIPDHYTERIVGFAGRKLFGDQIRLFIGFRNVLSSAPRLSPVAVSEMLQDRSTSMEQRILGPEDAYATWLQTQKVNTSLHAYLVTVTQLLIRQAWCLSALLPNPRDMELFFDESSVFVPYLQQLVLHGSDLKQDFETLQTAYKALLPPVQVGNDTHWFQATVDQVSQATATASAFLKKLTAENTKVLANVPTITNVISQVHYTNIPWLVLDLLNSQGHTGTVTDGPRDGNRDLATERGAIKYLTQVKCHRFPPVSEQMVRNFAETCRTYGCEHGIFVTTYRFSRSATAGQWAMRDTDGVSQEKIASIELWDMQRLVELVIQYKIGIDAAGYLNTRYWTTMQIAGFRRSRRRKEGDGVGHSVSWYPVELNDPV